MAQHIAMRTVVTTPVVVAAVAVAAVQLQCQPPEAMCQLYLHASQRAKNSSNPQCSPPAMLYAQHKPAGRSAGQYRSKGLQHFVSINLCVGISLISVAWAVLSVLRLLRTQRVS